MECIFSKFKENELLALKRAGLAKGGGGAQHQVTFFTPETPGRVVYTLYIMSDAYLGLDQQYDLCLEVVEGHEEVRKFRNVYTISGSRFSDFRPSSCNEKQNLYCPLLHFLLYIA